MYVVNRPPILLLLQFLTASVTCVAHHYDYENFVRKVTPISPKLSFPIDHKQGTSHYCIRIFINNIEYILTKWGFIGWKLPSTCKRGKNIFQLLRRFIPSTPSYPHQLLLHNYTYIFNKILEKLKFCDSPQNPLNLTSILTN